MGTNKRYADAIDRRVKHTVPWHPIMDATEIDPGVWAMRVDSISPIYAFVRMVRRGDELGYRVESRDGELIGYYITLHSAVLNAWEMTIGWNDGDPRPPGKQ
jgi:hypothetical protein